MAEVYWIHLPEHTNMLEEGYIGFTSKTTNFRFKQHLMTADRGSIYPVHRAIRKHKNRIVVETLLVGSDEYCLCMELKLRPHKNIGWNLAVGGDAPLTDREYSQEFIDNLVARNKRGHSEETRQKLSESRKGMKATDELKSKFSEMRKGELNSFYGKEHTEESKKVMSETAKVRFKCPWNHPCANKSTWSIADEVLTVFVKNPGIKSPSLEKMVGLEKNKLLAMYEKFLQGWIPQEDPAWLLFKENYTKELNGT